VTTAPSDRQPHVPRHPAPPNAWHRWSALALTVGMAALAVTVQWGVVTTKLDHVEQRLDELIFEARTLRAEYQSLERRVSHIEGRLLGATPAP